MRDKVPFTLVCIAVLAFACGPRPRGDGASERSTTVKRSATTADARAPLSPTLDVAVTDEVQFNFDVTNAGARKVEVLFNDGRTHDIVVIDSVGREVWRWSEGRMFTQTVQSKVLRASDTLSFAESWTDAKPGSYIAVASLPSRNYPVEHRVAFTVR